MLFEQIKSITFFKSTLYGPLDSQAELAEPFVWRRVSNLWINVEWGAPARRMPKRAEECGWRQSRQASLVLCLFSSA